MESLEIGQIVRVTAKKMYGIGDLYEFGDLLRVVEREDPDNLGSWYQCINLTSKAKDVRIFPQEVEEVELIRVRMVKTFNYRSVWLRRGSELDLIVSGDDFSAQYVSADDSVLDVNVDYFEIAQSPDAESIDSVGKEIEFSDMRVGDRIRRETEYKTTSVVTEGDITEIKKYGVAYTSDRITIASSESPRGSVSSRMILVNRPEVNEFAEASVGSLAAAEDALMVFLKVGVNQWKCMRRNGSWISDDFRTDKTMKTVIANCKITYLAPAGFRLT